MEKWESGLDPGGNDAYRTQALLLAKAVLWDSEAGGGVG